MGVSGAPQVFGASAIVTWAKIRRCSGGFFGELESAVVGNELRVGLQKPQVAFFGGRLAYWSPAAQFVSWKMYDFPCCCARKWRNVCWEKGCQSTPTWLFWGEGPMLQKTNIGPEKMSHVFQSHHFSGTFAVSFLRILLMEEILHQLKGSLSPYKVYTFQLVHTIWPDLRISLRSYRRWDALLGGSSQ